MRKLVILFILSFFCFNSYGNETFWKPYIESIIQVESNGNPNAVSKCGKCVGAMQIKTIVVDDCNEYLKMIGSKKRFTYQDRYNINKSKEMFLLIQKRYNKSNDIEKGIRIWNGGCGYYKNQKLVKQSKIYYNKVISHVKKKSMGNKN